MLTSTEMGDEVYTSKRVRSRMNPKKEKNESYSFGRIWKRQCYLLNWSWLEIHKAWGGKSSFEDVWGIYLDISVEMWSVRLDMHVMYGSVEVKAAEIYLRLISVVLVLCFNTLQIHLYQFGHKPRVQLSTHNSDFSSV